MFAWKVGFESMKGVVFAPGRSQITQSTQLFVLLGNFFSPVVRGLRAVLRYWVYLVTDGVATVFVSRSIFLACSPRLIYFPAERIWYLPCDVVSLGARDGETTLKKKQFGFF